MAKMLSQQTVYYGPSYSGYPSVGSVSANESIDYLWTEGAWCYIRYSVSGTANKKCGYVPESAVNHTNETPLVYNDNNGGTRYIRSGGSTYTGPGGSGYVSAGSVDAGEAVTYTGYKYNNSYALIEYNVGSTSNKKRAWYPASDMTTDPTEAPTENTNTTIKDPISKTLNYTFSDHKDYEVGSGTPVYAMCDGVFEAKYCVGSMTSTTTEDSYVSLGICGNLYPSTQWETEDHRKPSKIQYGHLSSLNGYTCPSNLTVASYGSTESACTYIKKVPLGSQNVNCGDLLGYSGNTGNSSGPHLHIGLVY